MLAGMSTHRWEIHVRKTCKLLMGLALLAVGAGCLAAPAQEPLLNRPKAVPPNLLFLLDSSGSMQSTTVYEYGNFSAGGFVGPEGDSSTSTPYVGYYAYQSPDLNKLRYDPRVRYDKRVTAFGSPLSNPVGATNWITFFSRIGSGPYTTGSDPRFSDDAGYYMVSYPPAPAEVVAGSTASYPAFVTDTMPANTLFPKWRDRTDCKQLATACTLAEERENHGNWQYWHSYRTQMMLTALARTVSEIPDNSARIGWARYEDLASWGNSTATPRLARGMSNLDSGTRTALDAFISGYPFVGGNTPSRLALHRAGKYFERKDSDGPWATVPNPASVSLEDVVPSGPGKDEPPTAHASCRRSYILHFTDGAWNDVKGGGIPFEYPKANLSVGNADGAAGAPYADKASDTLADVAMSFWSRDLRPDLPDRVPSLTSPLNLSTWQNVTLYNVGLGVRGNLNQDAATFAELASGVRQWPVPNVTFSKADPATIDDLWHAAINGRGELIKTMNGPQMTEAFRHILNNIVGLPQTLSGVAVSSAYLRAGTRKYKPQYVPGDWYGRFSAIELDQNTGNEKVPPLIHWQVESGTSPAGDPITTIPAHDVRKVVTWNGSQGVDFTASTSGLSGALVNYVRGDASQEKRNGGTLRNRGARLGDIVNSNPVFIKDGVDLGYERLKDGNFGDYRAYYRQKAARAEGVVFVGANDGMLHGFRDSNGAETFAYVPRAVYGDLPRLAADPYVHHYYVDGPLGETDAYIGAGWKNILLGTTGVGAKAVFALDVTSPLAMNATSLLWEVNAGMTDFGDLGYVTTDVQSGVTQSGDWVAIFGNGVDNSSGAATLFVVNIATGQLVRKISAPDTGGNGLVGVRAIYDGNRRLVGVYGGDLKGNIWKFDLTGSSSIDWRLGLGGQALFAAGAGHPVTAAPAVVPHPKGGYMVVFGTGKLLEAADIQTPYGKERAYGVWDPVPFGIAGGTPADLSMLVKQAISPIQIGTPPTTYYQVTNNPVNYGQAGVRGWYMALDSGNGQRVIYPIERVSDGFVLLSTMSPESSVPADICTPEGSGSGWVYLLNAQTGSGPEKPAFDTTLDGTISAMDLPVAGYRDAVDGRPTAIDVGSSKSLDRLCIESADTQCTLVELSCGQAGARACPTATSTGLKSRQWRQIFPR